MAKRKKIREQLRQQEAAQRTRRRYIIVSSAMVLALGVFLYVWVGAPGDIKSGDGVLATPVSVHDFGPVPLSRGTVSTDLPLVNIGEEDLVISFLDSSCGCTTARVINGAEVGPVFGMSSHGRSPRDWRTVIKPGEKATLKIYYDPAVHPDFRGPGTRVVSITTNGRSTPEKQVRIKVRQID